MTLRLQHKPHASTEAACGCSAVHPTAGHVSVNHTMGGVCSAKMQRCFALVVEPEPAASLMAGR